MSDVKLTRNAFLEHQQGRTFADVAKNPHQPLDAVLEFFNDPARQQRMEDSEIHHARAALAGVVRELEAQPAIDAFLRTAHPRLTKRLRQVVGIVVRMVMEGRGWKTTGRKGSLGVRAKITGRTSRPGTYHNTGGLAFWFLRAERYERLNGMPFQTVSQRRRAHDKSTRSEPDSARRATKAARSTKRNGRSSLSDEAGSLRKKVFDNRG
jgi:hypothetical protein